MNFAELSAQRYSLRKFSDRPVEDALLQQVLEAGRNAPTAHNNQPPAHLRAAKPGGHGEGGRLHGLPLPSAGAAGGGL